MELGKDRPSILSVPICRVHASRLLPSDLTGIANQVGTETVTDLLAVEEPLEIRLSYGPVSERKSKSISITMRTPGHDFELAVGFLFTEGILRKRHQLRSVDYCGPSKNVVRVEIEPGVEFDIKKLERHFYTSSSCGVCGKSSLEALKVESSFVIEQGVQADTPAVQAATIHDLPDRLRETQGIFEATGGLHGCAIFDATGKLELVREDVGRHNALDKLIGCAFIKGLLPLTDKILLVSGRASFELVQKATMAGLPIFAAVGAPSSLAVALAQESRMTLLGFVRNQRFNIYSEAQRILNTPIHDEMHAVLAGGVIP
jgi:FdhD protein